MDNFTFNVDSIDNDTGNFNNFDHLKSNVSINNWITGKRFYLISVLIFLCISALNVPVIIVILSHICKGKLPRNIHILSLSFSDFAVGLCYLPLPNNKNICYHRIALFLICMSASSIHIVLIALDRTLIIVRNRTVYNKRQARIRVIIIILTTWILAPVTFLIPIKLSNIMQLEPQFCGVVTIWADDSIIKTSFAIHFTIYILLLVVACVWSVVVLTIRKRSLVGPGMEIPTVSITVGTDSNQIGDTNHNTGGYKKVHQKAIKTIFIIGLTFTICTLPSLFVTYIDLFNLYPLSQTLRRILTLLSSFNSFCNPIIYAFMIREIKRNLRIFRETMKDICC